MNRNTMSISSEVAQVPLLHEDHLQHQSSSDDYDPYNPKNIHQVKDEGTIKDDSDSASLYDMVNGNNLWQPLIFKRPITIVFLLVLLAAIAGLEAFLQLSHLNTGYSEPSKPIQIVFTYLPVSLLLLLNLYWRIYDLEVKKLAPWSEMRKKSVHAANSLLLDYISTSYPSILYGAAKQKHWPVLLVTIGSILIAISSIVSTSLWVILPCNMPSNPVALERTSSFSVGTFDNAANATFLSQYFGDLIYHLPQPLWTNDEFLFSSFRAIDLNITSNTGVVNATTEAYKARLECKPVHVSDAGNITVLFNPGGKVTYQARVSWGTCDSVVNITYSDYLSPFMAKNSIPMTLGEIGYIGKLYDINCTENQTTALVVARFNGRQMEDVSGLACTPVYTKFDALVTVNITTYAIIGIPTLYNAQDDVNLPSGRSLLYYLDSLTHNGVDDYGNVAGDRFYTWEWPDPLLRNTTNHKGSPSSEFSTWFYFISRVHNLVLDDLINLTSLASHSAAVFSEVFPYIALQTYTEPAQAAFEGFSTTTEKRLISKDRSVRTVQVTLILLVIAAAILYFFHPVTDLRENPSSIAAASSIIAASAEVANLFTDTGSMSPQELLAHLEGAAYSTNLDGGFTKILVHHLNDTPNEPIDPETKELWRPFMLRPIARILLGLVMCATIACLEVLLQISNRRDGLGKEVKIIYGHAAWTYAAPTILFLIGLAISAFDLAIRGTIPYMKLYATRQPAQILQYDPLFLGPFTLISRSLRNKIYSIALSTLAMLLVPAAKIVVAGVFGIDTREASESLELDVLDDFTLSFAPPTRETSGSSLNLFSLVSFNQSGSTRPMWTTESLAVASAKIPTLNGTFISANLPVAYSTLDDCCIENLGLTLTEPISDDTMRVEFDFLRSSCVVSSGEIDQAWTSIPLGPNHYYLDLWPSFQGADSNYPLHFTFGESPPEDFNVTGIRPKIASVGCNINMWRSIMNVTLYVDGNSTRIADVDHLSEHDRQSVTGFDVETAQWLYAYMFPIPPTPNTQFNTFFQILTQKNLQTPLSDYLDPHRLLTELQSAWSTYWALYAHQHLRYSVADSNQMVPASKTLPTQRVIVNAIPTRIIEGLFGAILLIILILSLHMPRRSPLYMPPFSIGAHMSILANSRLLDLLQGTNGAGRSNALAGLWVRLGWWDRPDLPGGRRYGIEIVEDKDNASNELMSLP